MPGRVPDAALTQLCLVGPDALTIEAIAERASVSVGLIYKEHHSLNTLVRDVLAASLPSALDAIPGVEALSRSSLGSRPEHRLPLEAILALRRFPDAHAVVKPIMDTFVQRTGPLRCAVVLGCQALSLAGVVPSGSDVDALIALEHRIRLGTLHDSPLRAIPLPVNDASVPHGGPEHDDPTSVRLRDAASQLLTESAGRASLRDIADKAGVTTGAVYRRYGSKDDLIGDTIKARLTTERTLWAQMFFAALADPTKGDPASILAEFLAQASAPDAAATRESIELVVAARTGPAARAALAERFSTAVMTRKAQLSMLAGLGALHHPDSADALAWAFQVAPTGARIAGIATPMPDAHRWRPSMAALLQAL